MATPNQPVLIIGAGVAGLTLAQACRKENIPYRIFERDASAHFRPAGWALTLNWSLPSFRSLLPDDILARLPETYVNKQAQAAGEKGKFAFYDVSNGEIKYMVPPSERIRVSRERLRSLLLSGINVEWTKAIANTSKDPAGGVIASFSDGTSASGSMLVACDGSHSTVRRQIHDAKAQNWELPVRIVGAKVKLLESQVAAVRKLDPYFFQGGDPRTDAYTFFSFIDSPSDREDLQASADGHSEAAYVCQIMMSWPYRPGFFGRAEPIEVPETAAEQLRLMKTISAEWTEPFRSLIHNLPDGTDVKSLVPSDWVPPPHSLIALDGRVALVGDAAHAMVMYRGEGANHSIVDVAMIMDTVLKPFFSCGLDQESDQRLKEAAEKYGAEVVERAQVAVLTSRQACLDAHDFKSITNNSTLISKRALRTDLEEAGAA